MCILFTTILTILFPMSFLFYVYESFVFMNSQSLRIYLVPAEVRRDTVTEVGDLCEALWDLGTKPRYSVKASVLNLRAIS